MSKKNPSFLLMSLLPACLLVSVIAVVQAQTGGTPAAKPNSGGSLAIDVSRSLNSINVTTTPTQA